ncbi:MAG TPA: hypothetical protein VIF09_26450, partial [Polyangiaceae bacterium]
MSFRWNRGMQLLGAVAVLGAAVTGAACGGGNSGGYSADAGSPDTGGGGGDAGNLTGKDGGSFGNTPNLLTISVTPATASIESLNGAPASQAFAAQGHYDDGSTATLTTGVTWTSGEPQVGSLGATGLYTASGSLGGVVAIQASYKGQNGAAQ